MNALHYSKHIEHLTEDYDETGVDLGPKQRVAVELAVTLAVK